jgi:hypothetical protein
MADAKLPPGLRRPEPKEAERVPRGAPLPLAPPRAPAAAPLVPFAPHRAPEPDARERRDRSEAEEQLLAEGRLGDPSVTAAELRGMGSLVAGRHLMTLLARRRQEVARAEVIREVAELLLGMDDGPWARRLLLQMAEAGRIVDIYPLEVMTYLVERHPGAVERCALGPVILNKALLEAQVHAVGGLIVLKLPLALKMKAFALEGGGAPGYVLAPGPPAHYLLEVHEPGAFSILVRGDIRRESLIDRAHLQVEEAPDSPS